MKHVYSMLGHELKFLWTTSTGIKLTVGCIDKDIIFVQAQSSGKRGNLWTIANTGMGDAAILWLLLRDCSGCSRAWFNFGTENLFVCLSVCLSVNQRRCFSAPLFLSSNLLSFLPFPLMIITHTHRTQRNMFLWMKREHCVQLDLEQKIYSIKIQNSCLFCDFSCNPQGSEHNILRSFQKMLFPVFYSSFWEFCLVTFLSPTC